MKRKLFLASFFIGLTVQACLADNQAKVQVTVTSVVGKTQYEYRVQNVAGPPIVRLSVGIDAVASEAPELLSPPIGWDFVASSGSLAGPTGWAGIVETQEESPFFSIVWARTKNSISHGETLGGFLATLMSADDHYRVAHWTVLRTDGTMTSGILQALEPAFTK